MPNNILDSYLVSLSANVDQASFKKFNDALLGAAKTTTSAVSSIAGDFLKWQISGVTAFATVGFGVIAFIDKLAMLDQKTQIGALKNAMQVQQYRSMTMALDILGVSLDDVVNGTKELQDRYAVLGHDQIALAQMIGPSYERQMQQVRDVHFELSRLELKGEYFGMKFASDLLAKLGFGDGGILLQLQHLNDFVLSKMPQWSDELATDVIPILHDFWGMLRDIGGMLAYAAHGFTEFESVITGDSSLDSKTTSFHQFAQAVGDAADQLAFLLKLMLGLEKAGGNAVGGIADTFKGLWHTLHGQSQTGDRDSAAAHWKAAWDALSDSSLSTGNKTVGGGPTANLSHFLSTMPKGGSGSSQAMSVAQNVSQRTGIPADLVYGQMAFETGNFSHLAGKNNFSGIKIVGTNTFRDFESLDKFAEYYGSTLSAGRYKNNGILNARTGAEYAHALKTPSGTYYGTDSEAGYGAGVEKYRKAYDIQVGSIIVNVPNTAHSGEQIAAIVKKGVADGLAQHTQDMMVQTSGAWK